MWFDGGLFLPFTSVGTFSGNRMFTGNRVLQSYICLLGLLEASVVFHSDLLPSSLVSPSRNGTHDWLYCSRRARLQMVSPRSLVISSGMGAVDLPLRASNEGLLRPRVARAQEIIRLHPLTSLLPGAASSFRCVCRSSSRRGGNGLCVEDSATM